jgi:hypothetical protein
MRSTPVGRLDDSTIGGHPPDQAVMDTTSYEKQGGWQTSRKGLLGQKYARCEAKG